MLHMITGHSLALHNPPGNRKVFHLTALQVLAVGTEICLSRQLLLRPLQLLGELLQRDVEKEFTLCELHFRRKLRTVFFCVCYFLIRY